MNWDKFPNLIHPNGPSAALWFNIDSDTLYVSFANFLSEGTFFYRKSTIRKQKWLLKRIMTRIISKNE